jgi:hypothetical protein
MHGRAAASLWFPIQHLALAVVLSVMMDGFFEKKE